MITSRFFVFGRSFVMATALGLTAVAASAQTPLSHYLLNGNEIDSGSLGINGTANGASGFVEGGVGRFSQALSVGGGTTDFFSADTNYGSFDALTITLWVNVSSFSENDRLVSTLTKTSGFDLHLKPGQAAGSDFNLAFGFNSTSGAVQAANANYVTGEWLFLAVTWDTTTDMVSFYGGNESGLFGDVYTDDKSGDSIAANTVDLEIGGTPASSEDRTPNAFFNDVRIYDTALDASAIEAVRLAAIPEPSHYAMIFGALAFGFIVIRKRSRG